MKKGASRNRKERIHMPDTEAISTDDLNEIRELGSKIIRNLSLFMDNPFSYAHLIEVCIGDLTTLAGVRDRCGLKGDGLLPAQPLGLIVGANPPLATVLLDAGFSRLRDVVDELIKPRKGGELNG